jgi:hypothetical protein
MPETLGFPVESEVEKLLRNGKTKVKMELTRFGGHP